MSSSPNSSEHNLELLVTPTFSTGVFPYDCNVTGVGHAAIRIGNQFHVIRLDPPDLDPLVVADTDAERGVSAVTRFVRHGDECRYAKTVVVASCEDQESFGHWLEIETFDAALMYWCYLDKNMTRSFIAIEADFPGSQVSVRRGCRVGQDHGNYDTAIIDLVGIKVHDSKVCSRTLVLEDTFTKNTESFVS
ncbi:hypothetical protein HG530_004538 [Fusarium avenaceum]|nr:hypothetical protein HG530_004538 [Fusarium avenaceum]